MEQCNIISIVNIHAGGMIRGSVMWCGVVWCDVMWWNLNA